MAETGEYVVLEVVIEKVFDGTAMEYEVLATSEKLSDNFLQVLVEDYDIEVEEYSEFVRTVVRKEDIIPEDE